MVTEPILANAFHSRDANPLNVIMLRFLTGLRETIANYVHAYASVPHISDLRRLLCFIAEYH